MHKWHAEGDVGTGAGKEMESSSFPLPITTSPLTNTFACHKWRGCSQSITFLGSRAHSLIIEPVYVRNYRKNSFCIHTNNQGQK